MTVNPDDWRVVLCDDLEKVRAHLEPRAMDVSVPLSAYLGQRVAVQLAFQPPPGAWGPPDPVDLSLIVDCPQALLQAHRVDQVPTPVPAWADHDDHYLDDVPGLFPDLMVPLGDASHDRWSGAVEPHNPRWTSVWIDVTVQSADAGPLTITLAGAERVWPQPTATAEPQQIARFEVPLEVTPATAPASPIVQTHWFHCDGLAQFHRTEPWSDLHWRAIDNAVAAAAEMGVTSLLTPVWTPPLDTAIGSTRQTCQLLDITVTGSGDAEHYSFGTDRLDRWVETLQRHGITGVEVSHPFSQWGATKTPQIWVDTDQGREQRFGWHVAATDPAYRRFLEAVVPFLRQHLGHQVGEQNVFWHVSDEPHEDNLATYTAARDVIVDLLDGAQVIDALSSPDYAGLVRTPVVATDHVKDFHERGIAPTWVYYCVGQARGVSNRFIAQPMVGHRVLASQLYAQQAEGFLHWGFNFYLSTLGRWFVDPFTDTSAAGGLPSGDPFVVYPGPDGGCWPSIRHRALAAMSHDLRVMHWAEQLAGRDAVLGLVDPDGACQGPLGYESPWPEPDAWRRMRLALDRLVRERLAPA